MKKTSISNANNLMDQEILEMLQQRAIVTMEGE